MADVIALIFVLLPFGAASALLLEALRSAKANHGVAWMDTLRA